MRTRRTSRLSLFAAGLGLLSLSQDATAQAPMDPGMGSVPGADSFFVQYYLTDEDGKRAQLMSVNHFNYFLNQARCQCGHQIHASVRLKAVQAMIDQSKLVETFVGTMCGTAESAPAGQFRRCAKLASVTVNAYIQGIERAFHPVWLVNGVSINSPNDARDPDLATAAGNCNDAQGEAGVWMCAQTNSQGGCQSDEFFIQGTQNNNIPAKPQMFGVKYDFLPPVQRPSNLRAAAGDGAVVLSWDLQTVGDIYGFRVLCEEVDTGAPPPTKSFPTPTLNANPLGTIYFTKDNLCPNGPFSTFKGGSADPLGTTGSTTEDSVGDSDSVGDTDGGDTDGGLDTDGGADTDGGVGTCGDGTIDPDEECDEGMDGNGDDKACRADCTRSRCGDGKVWAEGGEECDDSANPDACTVDCKLPVCGDGMIQGAEECDLGADHNGLPGRPCTAECTFLPFDCNDGVIGKGEACSPPTMGCEECLTIESCGDGIHQQPEEVCDWSTDDPLCSETCTIACGNGIIEGEEECDDGELNSDRRKCTSTCKNNTCGDGFILSDSDDASILEECDGNADAAGRPCSDDCKRARCGDGLPQGDEQCDLGDDVNGPNAACLSNCQDNVCGDGVILEGVEECDNGANNGPGKVCTSQCTAIGSESLRSLDWKYLCSDHLAAISKSVRIDGLENGKAYNFLLVPYDRHGNPRPVEEILQATPEDTRDLWEQCKAQGDTCGDAGFCSVSDRSSGWMGLVALAGLGLGAVGIVRRRRKRA